MCSERISYPSDRLGYIRALNSRTTRLDLGRVNECKEAIWHSYKASTVCSQIADVHREPSAESHRFRSIGLWSSIELDKFNAADYYWEPYFSDVGRVIARGERRYLHQRMGRQIRGEGKTISRSSPDFRVLTDRISQLARRNLEPDTLLAPVELMVPFVGFYQEQMVWPQEGPERLRIGDYQLKVFWSHKYATLRSFVIFSSRAGIWHVVADQDTGRPLSIALGESNQLVGRVEYFVETLVRYETTISAAFSRINLSS